MRKNTLKKMRAAQAERTERILGTGFGTAKELLEFNQNWSHLGVGMDEVWPQPKIEFGFLRFGANDGWEERDATDFHQQVGKTHEELLAQPKNQAHIYSRLDPVQVLNTSLHEAIHFVPAARAGFPHSVIQGPTIFCKYGQPTGVSYLPINAAVGFEPEVYKRFALEKRADCILMWIGPSVLMPALMSETTAPQDFANDECSAHELDLTTEEYAEALTAAARLLDDETFWDQISTIARRLRPLIQAGGNHSLGGFDR